MSRTNTLQKVLVFFLENKNKKSYQLSGFYWKVLGFHQQLQTEIDRLSRLQKADLWFNSKVIIFIIILIIILIILIWLLLFWLYLIIDYIDY